KIMNFLLTVFLFAYACTSNVRQEEQTNTIIDEQKEYSIYLDDFKPSGFISADFIKLQEIANKFPERLDTVPKDITYRLTSQDTNEVDFFCRWIKSIGVFRVVTDEYSNDFLVSFSE